MHLEMKAKSQKTKDPDWKKKLLFIIILNDLA